MKNYHNELKVPLFGGSEIDDAVQHLSQVLCDMGFEHLTSIDISIDNDLNLVLNLWGTWVR